MNLSSFPDGDISFRCSSRSTDLPQVFLPYATAYLHLYGMLQILHLSLLHSYLIIAQNQQIDQREIGAAITKISSKSRFILYAGILFSCGEYGKYPIGAKCPSAHRIYGDTGMKPLSEMLRACATHVHIDREQFMQMKTAVVYLIPSDSSL